MRCQHTNVSVYQGFSDSSESMEAVCVYHTNVSSGKHRIFTSDSSYFRHLCPKDWVMIPMRTALQMIRRMSVTTDRSMTSPITASKAPYVSSGDTGAIWCQYTNVSVCQSFNVSSEDTEAMCVLHINVPVYQCEIPAYQCTNGASDTSAQVCQGICYLVYQLASEVQSLHFIPSILKFSSESLGEMLPVCQCINIPVYQCINGYCNTNVHMYQSISTSLV